MIDRRRLLGIGGALLGVGALTVAGIETDVLPGRVRLHGALGLNGPAGQVPDVQTTLVDGRFFSKKRRADVGWRIAYPAGLRAGAAVPVLIALHGRGSDHDQLLGHGVGLDHFLAADPSLQFAIAAIDGGESYWHPRRSGEDAGAMVIEEFLPLLAEQGLLTDRVALFGISMGGYGALRLAGILGPKRVAAVVAVSPALFSSAGDTAPGSFDDAEDFAEHDVTGRQSELNGTAVRVDCGNGDPFKPAVENYRRGFGDDHEPAGGFEPGTHNDAYWRRMAPEQLRFVGEHLGG